MARNTTLLAILGASTFFAYGCAPRHMTLQEAGKYTNAGAFVADYQNLESRQLAADSAREADAIENLNGTKYSNAGLAFNGIEGETQRIAGNDRLVQGTEATLVDAAKVIGIIYGTKALHNDSGSVGGNVDKSSHAGGRGGSGGTVLK